jgi:hypothetical protein
MPYSDPEARRAYDRERKRTLRALEKTKPVRAVSPAARLRLTEDVEAVLGEAARLIVRDRSARDIEKGRALASLAGVALRLVEARTLQDRVAALERAFDLRAEDRAAYG